MNAPALNLSAEVAVAKSIVELIRGDVPDDDPDFLTLVESECDVIERLRRMLRAARHAENSAKALGEMIGEMRDRKTRFDDKATSLRATVSWALQELGIKSLESPDFTATLSPGKRPVKIVNEALLPDDLCRIKREPDKAKIKELLEAGTPLEGAILGNPQPVLTVRVR
jgi:hypothetical protein